MLSLVSLFGPGDLIQRWKEPFHLKRNKFSKGSYTLYEWPDLEVPPYDVRLYRVRMNVWDGMVQSARVDVKMRARDTLDSIRLYFLWAGVDSVRYNGTLTGHVFVGADTARSLIVYLPTPLLPGDSGVVEIFYHGLPPSSGCLGYGGGMSIVSSSWVYTDNEPYGLRCWIPSYDQPWEKADEGVEWYITTDSSLEVVANGILIDTTTLGRFKTWHYRHSHSIAPYLMTFGIRDLIYNEWIWNYDTVNMIVRSWVLASSPSYNWGDSLTRMLTAFSDRFGLYPFANEKYEQSVVLPGGWAMEDQTNSFFGSYASGWVQAHELAHQWWGNNVTCGTFKDIWLNEGFATYSEVVWYESVGGDSAYKAYYKNRVENPIFSYAFNPGSPVYNPGPDLGDLFSIYTYNKAAAVLHMLRYVLDKDTSLFFGALRYYRSQHEGSYALTSDFVEDVETYTGRDLSWFFNQWIYEAGWPVYNVAWNKFPDSGNWRLVLQVEQTQPPGAPTFKMPIEVKVIMGSSDTTLVIWDSLNLQRFQIILPLEPDSLIWDPDFWVLEQHVVTYDPTLFIAEGEVVEARREVVVRVRSKEVIVYGINSTHPVEIYSSSGRLVGRGKGKVVLHLPAGIYYAKSGQDLKAFVVK
ncbi:MAG: M1 family metallopeptidase [Thermotogae bacterium]|nr:M1 family metallopeptidase [Thermotogota bacterium]